MLEFSIEAVPLHLKVYCLTLFLFLFLLKAFVAGVLACCYISTQILIIQDTGQVAIK